MRTLTSRFTQSFGRSWSSCVDYLRGSKFASACLSLAVVSLSTTPAWTCMNAMGETAEKMRTMHPSITYVSMVSGLIGTIGVAGYIAYDQYYEADTTAAQQALRSLGIVAFCLAVGTLAWYMGWLEITYYESAATSGVHN